MQKISSVMSLNSNKSCAISVYLLTPICPVNLSILINWTSPSKNIGVSGARFILIEIPVCKQCRPWSDAAFCGISFGSTLSANAPNMQKGKENELPHDLCVKRRQISLGIRPVWSASSLSAWGNIGPLTTYWAHTEDSDQTGRMPRLIRVFAGRTCHFVGFVVRWLKWKLGRLLCNFPTTDRKNLPRP